MAKKYRVKAGKHHEGGRIYKTGDVVESDKPLAKLFVNKFEIVREDDVEASAGVAAEDLIKSGVVADADDNKHGMDYKPPNVIPPQPRSAKDNLRPETDPNNPKSQKAPARLDSEDDDEEGETEESPFGADVSDQYPEAEEKGVRVFRKINRYTVTKNSDRKTALNEKHLKKQEVSQFIEAS